jgi:PAS domain-containing protein
VRTPKFLEAHLNERSSHFTAREEAVVLHDRDGFIRFTDARAEKVLNLPLESLLGRRSLLDVCPAVLDER